MRKLEVKIKHVIWAFKESFKPSECYSVQFQGITCNIKPSFTGYNIWNVTPKITEGLTFYRVKGSELKVNLHSFNRVYQNFKHLYRHQKWSWYSIDIQKPFRSRISYINSDNIQF